jgi:undecaprenyl-diphosphatase
MDTVAFWQAISLGIIEGLTEFLPISSTGHLILAERLLGFTEGGRAFKIVIQLGAILAVCVVFAPKLLGIARDLPRKPEAQRFTRNILLAFLPAMLLGATLYKQVQALLDNPYVVCAALIAGGVVILLVDRLSATARVHAVEDVSARSSLLIGGAQVLAMVPGTSRSAATIIGAMALGVDRRTAAEFSFVLAIPTMLAATAYSLYKEWTVLSWDGLGLIAVGTVAAFVCALLVVRLVLALIARIGWAPFGWYRIVLGVVMLVVLYRGG